MRFAAALLLVALLAIAGWVGSHLLEARRDPWTLEVSAELPASRENVFAHVYGFGHFMQLSPWMAFELNPELHWSGPVAGPGARVELQEGHWFGDSRFELRAAEWPARVEVTMQSTRAPPGFYEIRLEERGEQRTQVSWRIQREAARNWSEALALWMERRELESTGDSYSGLLSHLHWLGREAANLSSGPGDIEPLQPEWVQVDPFDYLCTAFLIPNEATNEQREAWYSRSLAGLKAYAQQQALNVSDLPVQRWGRREAESRGDWFEVGLPVTGSAEGLQETADYRSCHHPGGPALRQVRTATNSINPFNAFRWGLGLHFAYHEKEGLSEWAAWEHPAEPQQQWLQYDYQLLDCAPPDPACRGNPVCVCQAYPGWTPPE